LLKSCGLRRIRGKKHFCKNSAKFFGLRKILVESGKDFGLETTVEIIWT
jgi:hypothetical protein